MNDPTSTVTGCGSNACQCSNTSGPVVAPTAYINGIALHAAGQRPNEDELRERAYTELLRQQAVMKGLLPRHKELTAPELGEAERQIIEAMVDEPQLNRQLRELEITQVPRGIGIVDPPLQGRAHD